MPKPTWSEQDVLERENRERDRQIMEYTERATGFMEALRPFIDNPAHVKAFNDLTGPEALEMAKKGRALLRNPRQHPERDLERACSDLLQYDGWRLLRCEPVSRREWGRGFGEKGMADCLYIRYSCESPSAAGCQRTGVLWIEWKSLTGKAQQHQKDWHARERARGALVVVAGVDFKASVDGWLAWYRGSGLMRRAI